MRSHRTQHVIVLEYAIGQRVRIDSADVSGVVKKAIVTEGSIEYFVAYFDDDKVRREEWLGADELSRVGA